LQDNTRVKPEQIPIIKRFYPNIRFFEIIRNDKVFPFHLFEGDKEGNIAKKYGEKYFSDHIALFEKTLREWR
jgi:hypothetical protein